MKTRVCKVCGKEKPIERFLRNDRPRPRKTCSQCRRQKLSKIEQRHQFELRTYGIRKEDLGEQKCQVCGSEEKLHIDHCHDSGRVRGLLCRSCNIGLGNFKDNIERMGKAIEYLRRSL